MDHLDHTPHRSLPPHRTLLHSLTMWGTLAALSLLPLGVASLGAAAETTPLSACGTVDNTSGSNSAAACCSSLALPPALPGQSEELRHSFCELLIFPTLSLLDVDAFLEQVSSLPFSNSQSASADDMTLPSMWWNRDILPTRLGGHRLIRSWLAYEIKDSRHRVIDMELNPQIWGVLTYSERYAVLNQLGTAAESFGYNLRFFYGQARRSPLVGLYVCENPATSSDPTIAPTGLLDDRPCTTTINPIEIVQLQRDVLEAQALPATSEPIVETVDEPNTASQSSLEASDRPRPPTTP